MPDHCDRIERLICTASALAKARPVEIGVWNHYKGSSVQVKCVASQVPFNEFKMDPEHYGKLRFTKIEEPC